MPPSDARPTIVLAAATGPASEVAITATGILGYGAGWVDAATSQIKVQYISDVGSYGAAITLGTGHALDMAGYFLDDTQGKKPVVDGFAATWIGTDGNIYFQRAGVFLDNKKEPVGAVSPAGVDGIPARAPNGIRVAPNSDNDAALMIDAGGQASDTSLTITHDGEIALAWTAHVPGGDGVFVKVMNANGSQNFSADLQTLAPAGAHIDSAWLAAGVSW